MDKNMKAYLERLWHELEPVVTHGIVVIVLDLFLIALALLAKLLDQCLPGHENELSWIKTADLWLILFLMVLFGCYTLLAVIFRLVASVRAEIRHRAIHNLTAEAKEAKLPAEEAIENP